MARPKLFSRCPECGADTLVVIGTQQQGHCRNRWCECSACGARVRWVISGTHGHWVRVREIKSPETPKASCC